jgi:hypothetical protein
VMYFEPGKVGGRYLDTAQQYEGPFKDVNKF